MTDVPFLLIPWKRYKPEQPIHINFKILFYILYSHTFSPEMKIKICKNYPKIWRAIRNTSEK